MGPAFALPSIFSLHPGLQAVLAEARTCQVVIARDSWPAAHSGGGGGGGGGHSAREFEKPPRLCLIAKLPGASASCCPCRTCCWLAWRPGFSEVRTSVVRSALNSAEQATNSFRFGCTTCHPS